MLYYTVSYITIHYIISKRDAKAAKRQNGETGNGRRPNHILFMMLLRLMLTINSKRKAAKRKTGRTCRQPSFE